MSENKKETFDRKKYMMQYHQKRKEDRVFTRNEAYLDAWIGKSDMKRLCGMYRIIYEGK